MTGDAARPTPRRWCLKCLEAVVKRGAAWVHAGGGSHDHPARPAPEGMRGKF